MGISNDWIWDLTGSRSKDNVFWKYYNRQFCSRLYFIFSVIISHHVQAIQTICFTSGNHGSPKEPWQKWLVMRNFGVFFFISLTELFNKQSSCKWLETPRHRRDVNIMNRPSVVLLGYWLVAIKDKVVAGRKIQTDHSAPVILGHGYYISAFEKTFTMSRRILFKGKYVLFTS